MLQDMLYYLSLTNVILGELRYINNNSNKIVKNTVDFKLLEEKLKQWNEDN